MCFSPSGPLKRQVFVGKVTHQTCHFPIFPRSTLTVGAGSGSMTVNVWMEPHSSKKCGIPSQFLPLKVHANFEVYSVT